MAAKSMRAIILENAVSQTPLRPRDLSRKFGIKVNSIYRTTARLRAEGKLPPAVHVKHRNRTTAPLPVARSPLGADEKHTVWVQKDVDEIVNSPVMSEAERLRKLSVIGRHGPDAVAIAAMKALEELGRAKGSGVGPGIPLTDDERTARLARLCTAVGREIAERAFALAFSEANVELPQETDQEHPRTPESDSDVD